jgi:hypothetical protein
MRTTLNQIRAHSPCRAGWEKLLRGLNKTESDDEPLWLDTVLDTNGLDDALWCLRAVEGCDREIRLYAVWCARRVRHLMNDPRSVAALDVAERYARHEASDEELSAAEAAAAAAAEAARWAAAEAAAEAAEAARLASAARSAAEAARWAAAAAEAQWAASAARSAAEAAAAAARWAARWAASAAVAEEAARDTERAAQVEELRRVCREMREAKP